jgi:hypothetical protein
MFPRQQKDTTIMGSGVFYALRAETLEAGLVSEELVELAG